MIRRILAVVVAFAFVAGLSPLAQAQSDTGEITIVVQDANAKVPVVLARVLLDGPVVTSEFTGNDGRVKFIDVPDGIYRARVFARGFQAVTSANFEVLNGRATTITVALAQSTNSPLRTIASVVSRSTATISTSTVNSDSAQRKLSDTLADALGKLSGVNVQTSSNDSDATQTVSLEGQDASQTAMSVNGIPLNAPGMAGDTRALNSDLFSNAAVSFGPQAGGFGAGGVGFSTLQPTLSWQSQFTMSLGSLGKNNYSFSETGSLGKLGVSATHTFRTTPSLLDGMQYLDTSGLYYTHEGDRNSIGTTATLRYQLTDTQTLSGMYLHSVNGAELVCTQFTGPVPCGYGPNNFTNGTFDLYSLTDAALIGDTQFSTSLFQTRSNSTNDLLNRFVNGIAQPTGTQSTSTTTGLSFNATLPAQQRHTISISGSTTTSHNAFTPLVAQAAAYTFPGQSSSYASLSLNDSIRSNTKLRFNDSIGISHASNAPSTLLLGLGTTWQPTTTDTYAFNYNLGGASPRTGRQGILTDPAQLRIDCNGNVAYGSAPGDNPSANSSTSARLTYTHNFRAGQFRAQIYRQSYNNILLPVEVNGSALTGSGIFPPNYFTIAHGVYVNECGVPVSTPFGPQNTYFTTPISGVQRVYEGFQLNGYLTLGNLVVEPFYDTQVAKANSNDPRFLNPYAITISGNQLPGVPLHRAGVVFDYKTPPSPIEWLMDANYTGANNSQNLPAYTTVDAGVDIQGSRGTLTFAASNIFNTYGGIFASSQGSVPYTTANGIQIPTIARPNTPRQYSFTYTVRFGQNVRPSAARTGLAGVANEEFGGGPGGRGGGAMGAMFRQMMQLPQSPPSNPFAFSTLPLCTADSQKIVGPMLAALKAYTAQIEDAKTPTGYPATPPAPPVIPGVTIQYHPLGSTYALSVSTGKVALLQPLFTCATFHIADQQTVQQRKLYVEPNAGGPFTTPTLTFMPQVGLYMSPRPPAAGQETFRLYKLPATPPKTPFAYNPKSPTCSTAQLRQNAQTALAELQAHFTKGAPAVHWTIAPHAAKAGTWYSLVPDDIGTGLALVQCGHVSAASRDDLTKLGWDAGRGPSINYAPPLGLYTVTGGAQVQVQRAQSGQGGGFGGGFMFQIFGRPSPSPSPSPAPSSTPH